MLVRTQSCYAAIYDESSPVNVGGFMKTLLARAQTDAPEGWLGIFQFNDYLMNHARRGDLIPWTLLFDGVFECDVQVVPMLHQASVPLDNLSRIEIAGALHLPSGAVVVSCLGDLGKPHIPILRVKPGAYRVFLSRNLDQEYAHSWLETEASYPPGDGPDWTLRLLQINKALTDCESFKMR